MSEPDIEALAKKLLTARRRSRDDSPAFDENDEDAFACVHPEEWAGPCVYFVAESGSEEGPVKIGHTRDLSRRLRGLQTSNAAELEVLCVAPSFDPEGLERAIHYRLGISRMQGEWFRRTPALEWLLKLVSNHFCSCCQDLVGPSASLDWLVRHWSEPDRELEKPAGLRSVTEIDKLWRSQGVSP